MKILFLHFIRICLSLFLSFLWIDFSISPVDPHSYFKLIVQKIKYIEYLFWFYLFNSRNGQLNLNIIKLFLRL